MVLLISAPERGLGPAQARQLQRPINHGDDRVSGKRKSSYGDQADVRPLSSERDGAELGPRVRTQANDTARVENSTYEVWLRTSQSSAVDRSADPGPGRRSQQYSSGVDDVHQYPDPATNSSLEPASSTPDQIRRPQVAHREPSKATGSFPRVSLASNFGRQCST